jgi:nuclear pore complex protein Nup98-Nup96
MKTRELERVQDFKIIHDEHGWAQWPGETNLCGLNLDLLVRFEQGAFEVYPEDLGVPKPEVGAGLNKPILVFLTGVWPRKVPTNNTLELKQYKQLLENVPGCKLVDYSARGEWCFKVDNL